MDPRLRTALVTIAASIAAVYLGWQVADGAYALPALASAAIIATILVKLTRLSADIIFVGLLIVGYIVGNRGFAQLMPAPGLPVLPAEAGLLVAFCWRAVLCAFERRPPLQRDALNWAIVALIAVGSTRMLFDVPRYGLLAVRDFAMIYYAGFFFIAQHMAREEAARRFLIGCLVVATVLLGPSFALFHSFEMFFLTQLTVHNAPLIYYKGDLAITFMAVGSLVIFHTLRDRMAALGWMLSGALFLFVLANDNRASQVGAFAAALLLLLARRWRYPAFQAGLGGFALLVAVALALLFNNGWAENKLHGMSDRIRSVVDIAGTGSYDSVESHFKGDNNRFRLTWWRSVAETTWNTNPVFGQGFGADLAQGFVQEYYPDNMEEFSTRSPHNIFLTYFGRMGAAGLLVWLGFCAVLLRQTWWMLRTSDDPTTWSLWTAVWIILVSGTFGVVLEGPMGAVVFWSLLGVANARPKESPSLPVPEPAELTNAPAELAQT